jgi:hypothetical protein
MLLSVDVVAIAAVQTVHESTLHSLHSCLHSGAGGDFREFITRVQRGITLFLSRRASSAEHPRFYLQMVVSYMVSHKVALEERLLQVCMWRGGK